MRHRAWAVVATVTLATVGYAEDLSLPPTSLDVLYAPSSPAFTLLGISPTEVSRPSNPTDVAVSILNKSNYLSAVPTDYALEVSPYWLVSGTAATFSDFQNDAVSCESILQSLTFSLGSSSTPIVSSSGSSMALAVRFSLYRGKGTGLPETVSKALELVNETYHRELVAAKKSPSEYASLTAVKAAISRPTSTLYSNEDDRKAALASIDLQIAASSTTIEATVRKTIYASDDVKAALETIEKTRMRREGFKWEWAGGTAVDFVEQSFDRGKVARSGIWTTIGDEWKKGSIMATFRGLVGRNASIASTYDAGGKLSFDLSEKLSTSVEGIYRRSTKAAQRDQWRSDLAIEYQVSPNKLLQFTFGRDYGGNKTGNLISALNLVLGFGSSRGRFTQ